MDFLEDLFDGFDRKKKHGTQGQHSGHGEHHDSHDRESHGRYPQPASHPHQTTHASANAAAVCCGVALPADARFCPRCGATAKQTMFCSGCGQTAVEGAKFCHSCGKPLW